MTLFLLPTVSCFSLLCLVQCHHGITTFTLQLYGLRMSMKQLQVYSALAMLGVAQLDQENDTMGRS